MRRFAAGLPAWRRENTLASQRSLAMVDLGRRYSISVERTCASLILASSVVGTRQRRPAHLPQRIRHGLIPPRSTRTLTTLADLHPALLAPTVFAGLLLTLWLYKSLMLVLFQEKIIYMPFMPPFARSERVEDYATVCQPVAWREERVKVGDGVEVGILVGRVREAGEEGEGVGDVRKGKGQRNRVVLCYFHGNGGSLPPRLPMLSNVLKSIHAQQQQHGGVEDPAEVVLVALSYRGYWTSSGKPSQKGIERDAQALLRWVNETYGHPSSTSSQHRQESSNTSIILWGQSIGAGVATAAAATYHRPHHPPSNTGLLLPLAALILETPFTSIRAMLLALYPQKWLPYRYLAPFLRSHWDSEAALRNLASTTTAREGKDDELPRTLILSAGKDELVPEGEAGKLARLCAELGMRVAWKEVKGALHTDATVRREGREGVAGFVVDVGREVGRRDGEREDELVSS